MKANTYGKGQYGKGAWRARKPALSYSPVNQPVRDRQRQAEVGPFRIQGKRASDLEWRVYKALLRLGWDDSSIEFQVPVMGGRHPGGAVLDFVVWTPGMPIVIEPNGDIWHTSTTAQRERDKQREAAIRSAWRRPFRYLVLPQGDIPNDEVTYDRLLREVGRHR